jgi:serine/threonine protein kinase/tetratricopeptide (TPR) repeat protein
MHIDQDRAKSIFLNAADIASLAEREAYLDAQCGSDEALRREVADLLSHHAQAQVFLESPASAILDTVDAPSLSECPGTLIGPYKLLQQIGEGGMGAVWMAEQTQPVRRKVALKVIKPGMDSAQVVARFEAERQALALMDHPNVARVLDAGTTAAGRPFFVMELVKGTPITTFCDDKHLSVRERLELFGDVCRAVQHAHQKGIIHRDLKPGNILVAPFDGKPVVKVIDFGVAKATGQRLTDATLFTAFGAVVGTPEYMSPEQAETNNQDIDTRSDIYSLGVLLYELLTGSTPLTKKRIKEAALLEVLRVIREEEPPRPSTRLSSAEELPSISAQRHTEPAKLTRLVRGELDWIVMKALEKDRNRRYETANGFAMDVQRYLADEPVLACSPSAAYRVRKFVRRHRGPVLAAALVALALVGGMVGTTIGLLRAQQAQKSEAEQRRIAEDERAVAQAVNDFLQDDLLRQADSQEQADRGFDAEPNLTVKEALNRAAERIGDRFRDRRLVEAAIRQTIGRTYHGLGEYERALPHLKRAVDLRTAHLGPDHLQTVESKSQLASLYVYLDRPDEALAPFEDVVRVRRETLGPAHPDTLEGLIGVSYCYRKGRRPEAIAMLEDVLRLAKANLPPNHRITLKAKTNLSNDYRIANRLPEATALQEEVLQVLRVWRGPRHPQALIVAYRLAMCYVDSGRYPEAIALHEETLRLMKEVHGPEHRHILTTMWGLANAYRGAGRPADAAALLKEAIRLREAKLGVNDIYLPRHRRLLAELYLELGKYNEAEPLARRCLEALENEYPNEWYTFECRALLGGALLGRKKYADAEPLLVAGYEGLKKQGPKIPWPKERDWYLGQSLKWLVQLYEATARPQEAAKWRKALEAQTKAPEGAAKPKEHDEKK